MFKKMIAFVIVIMLVGCGVTEQMRIEWLVDAYESFMNAGRDFKLFTIEKTLKEKGSSYIMSDIMRVEAAKIKKIGRLEFSILQVEHPAESKMIVYCLSEFNGGKERFNLEVVRTDDGLGIKRVANQINKYSDKMAWEDPFSPVYTTRFMKRVVSEVRKEMGGK